MVIKNCPDKLQYKKINKKINKTIHWVRHGETLSNISELNYQIIDPELTLKGRSQCDKLFDQLNQIDKNLPIDLIVVSPLFRTLQTMDLSCTNFIYKCPIISLDIIREQINQLCHKRKDLDNIKKKFFYVNFSNIENDDILYKKFNGMEPDSHVISRCEQFMDWIRRRKEKNIIVITHGGFLSYIFNNILYNEPNKSYFSNCELRTVKL